MPGSWRNEDAWHPTDKDKLVVLFSVVLYVARKRSLHRKCARFVLFRIIKKRSFNLWCVLDLQNYHLQNEKPSAAAAHYHLTGPALCAACLESGLQVRTNNLVLLHTKNAIQTDRQKELLRIFYVNEKNYNQPYAVCS